MAKIIKQSHTILTFETLSTLMLRTTEPDVGRRLPRTRAGGCTNYQSLKDFRENII